MYKKVRELTTKMKPSGLHSGLLDADESLISESSELINMWKTYTEQLFDDIRISEYTHDEDVYGSSILRSEVETAIRSLKCETNISEKQFGFRSVLGTREAIRFSSRGEEI